MYRRYFKVIFDYLFCIAVLVLLMPFLLFLTIVLLIFNKGTPFFLQERPGKDERIFNVIKFKTMNDKCDNVGRLLPSIQRLTPIGRFLRNSSLDELPQLINILLGHISFVGPRPLRVEYLPHYSQRQAKRHSIKPGITGWAQIYGRNTISWDERFELDIWYVENQSFIVDVKILILTIYKVIRRDGVNQSAQTTMEPFKNVDLNG